MSTVGQEIEGDAHEPLSTFTSEMDPFESRYDEGIMQQIENYDISEESLSYPAPESPLRPSQREGGIRGGLYASNLTPGTSTPSVRFREDDRSFGHIPGSFEAQPSHFSSGRVGRLGASIAESRSSFEPSESFATSERSGLYRSDLIARNDVRDLIFNALISDHLSAPERVALLDDAKSTAEQTALGIPFRALVSEPVYPLGVPPLMYELTSCQPQWDDSTDENDGEEGSGLDLVVYLINNWNDNHLLHGKMGKLTWVIRTACLRRFDEDEANRLFQQLRPIVFEQENRDGHGDTPYAMYDLSLSPLELQVGQSDYQHGFSALISVPYFSTQLRAIENANSSTTAFMALGRPEDKKIIPRALDRLSVAIEFFAARRAWRLDVGSNELELTLVDGPGGHEPCPLDDDPARNVDASAKIIAPDAAAHFEQGALELLFPPALLRPMAFGGSGSHVVSVSPCFGSSPFMSTPFGETDKVLRGLDDVRLQHDNRGTLLLELTVRLTSPTNPRFTSGSSNTRQRKHVEDASHYYPPLPPSRSTLPNAPLTMSEPPVADKTDWTEEFERIKQDVHDGNMSDAQSEDSGDLYIREDVREHAHEDTLLEPDEQKGLEESLLEASDWETVSRVDETEEKEGEWVNAEMGDENE